jgi:predicted enzyme related to lactoylglutathione lyase
MLEYDNFFLPAEDLAASRAFYEKTLGLKIKFDFSGQGMLAFQVGDQEPAIILKDVRKFPGAKPTIWLVVADVKDTYAELKKQGVKFLSEPFPIKTGWAVEFEDPAGNRLGVTDYSKTETS